MVATNKEAENCWEFWDCPDEMRVQCSAYTLNADKDCFNLATDFCPKLKVEFKHCWECPWYKKIQQDIKQKGN